MKSYLIREPFKIPPCNSRMEHHPVSGPRLPRVLAREIKIRPALASTIIVSSIFSRNKFWKRIRDIPQILLKQALYRTLMSKC
jgi:hypothetical protein